MRIALIMLACLVAAPAVAKLPPVSDEAKAKAEEAAAKSAWTDKIGAYKTCIAMDRAADNFRQNAKTQGKIIPEPTPGLSACADPGPYVAATPPAAKPLEASGAHSPPGNATSPPSSKATTAEIAGGVKKPGAN